MPVFRLPREIAFPDPELADPGGLLAVGGDLSVERLLAAYSQGVFPWPHAGLPLLWFSPDPRLLLEPSDFHRSRSLERTLRRGVFQVRADTAFDDLVRACATQPRGGERGTWITAGMRRAYGELHRLGFAHSIEVWSGDELAGGLYGLSLGGCFFGESMCSRQPDASKVAMDALCGALAAWEFDFVDCQLPTPHLESLGGKAVPRREYLERLAASLERATRRGAWTLP